MALNEFKLAQNTAQVQWLLNRLLANALPQGYTLVTSGNGDIQFERTLHPSDEGLITYNSMDNSLSIDVTKLHSRLNIPTSESFEVISNKTQTLNGVLTDDQYPTAKAVTAYLSDRGVHKDETQYSGINTLVQRFTEGRFTSGLIYTFSNFSDDSQLTPCIVMQTGATGAPDNYVCAIMLWKHNWRYLYGKTNADGKIEIEIDNTYDLSELATNASLNQAKTDFSQLLGALPDSSPTYKGYVDSEIAKVTQGYQTYIDDLIMGILEGEY